MDKILERLKFLAQNGDQEADRLYVDLFEINQAGDNDAAALWMVENEPARREVLAIDVVQDEAMNAKEPEMLELAKQYAELHNAGASMFSGNDKLSPSGKKLNTLDDFIAKSNYQGSVNDDVRAAFTNPENPQYWKNMDDVAKTESAMLMGYDNVADWERDLDREARMFQTRNRVEGWDADNNLNPVQWVGSTLLGLGAPRVKDAMLAGRDISKEDIIGDMAELGLNFVPGVGLVGKGGNIVKRIAVNAAEAAAVPLGTNALDLALYSGDPTNPRGDTDPVNFAKRVAAQTAGIAGAKGSVKAAGMGAKNFAEQLEGGQSGKDFIRNFGEALDDIGTKTEDIIKRRQLALDRKAELASQRKNVEMPGDNDVRSAVNSYTPDDVVNAEDFRNLVNEARRLKQSEPIRQTYNTAMETASDAGGRNARNIAEQYRTANEASPDMLFQLDDGRIVRGVRLSDNGLAYADKNNIPDGAKIIGMVAYKNGNNGLIMEKDWAGSKAYYKDEINQPAADNSSHAFGSAKLCTTSTSKTTLYWFVGTKANYESCGLTNQAGFTSVNTKRLNAGCEDLNSGRTYGTSDGWEFYGGTSTFWYNYWSNGSHTITLLISF